MTDQLYLAIRNNAEWCDLVCQAHGQPGRFHESAWVNTGPVPEFYPNVISLNRSADTVRHVETLVDAGLAGRWGVKDSYACLDLGPGGFEVLFEAIWFWRDPPPSSWVPRTRWRVIASDADLAIWENAWAGDEVSPEHRVFPRRLLRDERLLFLLGYSGDGSQCGMVASRSGSVVGLSNCFGDMCPTVFGEALAVVGTRFPGLPLVGYEPSSKADFMNESGFKALGPLRVWLKTSDNRVAAVRA